MILIIHDGKWWQHINQYGITGLLWAWIDALPECWRVFGLLVHRGGWMFGTVLLEVYCTASPWLLHGRFLSARNSWTLQSAFRQLEENGLIRENMWKLVSIPEYSEHSTGVCNQQGLCERGQIFGHLAQPLSSSSKRAALSLRSVFGSPGMFDPVEFRSCHGALDFRAGHTLPRHDQEYHDRIRWAHCSVELKDVLLAAFNLFIYIDPSWHAWFRFIFQKHCAVHSLYFFRNYAGVICT